MHNKWGVLKQTFWKLEAIHTDLTIKYFIWPVKLSNQNKIWLDMTPNARTLTILYSVLATGNLCSRSRSNILVNYQHCIKAGLYSWWCSSRQNITRSACKTDFSWIQLPVHTHSCWVILHACARGKAISSARLSVTTKISRSENLGISGQ